jgi:uncharacterized protein (TIGR03083 family)
MRTPLPMPVVADRFAPMRAELLRILHGLSDADWHLPTVCPGWSVRDVALHILGDDVGLLSNLRDHDGQYGAFTEFDDLVTFINQRNAVWIDANRLMSRRILLHLLADLGAAWQTHAAAVDPAMPFGPIGWTGNAHDPMGLHLARELTEYWMHHQHIADAVGVTSLKDRHFLHPVLSTFVYCLPRTYAEVSAPLDTVVKVVITGEAADEWHLVREAEGWQLYAQTDLLPAATITLSDDTAWRLFTKGLDPAVIPSRLHVTGDAALGAVMAQAVAILA